ncbi:MAG: fructose-6-phosphate aldolase [Planctomycetia bacterium]
MKLFLDTADVAEIRRYAAWGIVDGVTTNPTLVARSGRVFEEVVAEICTLVDGPVSAEVTALEAGAMVEQGLALAALHRNVVVKVPLVPEGLKATRELARRGVRTNLTLCFSVTQALLAARAGATLVSPFVGRLDDTGVDGMAVVAGIVQCFRQHGLATQVLVASVRGAEHVRQAALLGAHCATVPPRVLDEMVGHPLTDKGLAQFLADWASRARA